MASCSSLPQSKDDYHAFSGIEPQGIRRRVSESTTGYDVFINHRGPDSKLALALPLYDSLKDSGIRAFLDLEEMELGQSFPSTIETAIRSAAVHIAIFSKRYAESPWCLAELLLMQQTRAKIIPVFYGVEPWELRHIEKGVYAGAFTKFQSKSRFFEKLDDWKKALQSISYTAGHEIKDLNVRDFSRIVKAVEEEVRKARFLHVAEHPVALDKIVRDFERRCLHTLVQDFETHCRMNEGEMKAKTVGVYGMGGIGKTTLCKELFNRMRRQYDRACFLFDVREASANSKLTSLQEKLVKDLFSEEYTSIYSTENGSSYIRNRIKNSSSQSFLIVLDDIDHLQQLDALPIMHMPGNSLVIITTRDEGILLGDRVEVRYHLKEMVKEDARQLFSLHAFSRPYPDSGYEQLVDDFVGVCGGLPLSLQVVGRQVRGRNERYWRSVLEKLGGGYLHPDIKNILQISFDALDYEEQQIFIDIACFFVDHLTSTAIRLWEASGWHAQYGLQTLKDRCLVEELVEELVEDECLFEETDDPVSILRMHDHLRDLGREMANTRNHPPRLWRLQDLKKLESEGFAKILSHTKKRCFYSFFDVSLGSRITFLLGESDESATTSTSLLLLQLDVDEDENTPDSIPSWIPLQHIKHLRICNGDFNRLWQQDVQAPSQLRALEISGTSLRNFPDFIGVVADVENEVIEGEDTAAIGGLPLLGFSPTNLQSSNDCRKPTTVKTPLSLLEDLVISELESIIEIEIRGNLCPKLKSLELFCMENLTEVRFSNCEDFEKLNCLKISECEELKRLSVTANLKLEEINISACPQLEEVYLDNMGYLKRITIANCNLKNVQGISVSRMLEELNISRCSTLHALSLAQLDRLRKVKIEKCNYLTSVTGISNLPKLVELSISLCWKLQLELHLVGLNFLKKIAVDSSVVMTKCFRLDGCKNLEIVSGAVINFGLIQVFNISACPKLRELPVICGASRLQTITVNGCVKLNYLEVMNCRILESLSGVFDLAVLSIKDCPILEELPCLGNMTCLKEVHILRCGNLRNITLPMTLKRLELNACGELKSLSGISALTEMVELNIRACPKLYELGVAHFSKLEKLAIANLEKVFGISNLTKLLELEISECRDIEFELCLSGMSCLENIAIIKSEKMQTMTLPPSLTKLTLEACRELKKVAGVSGHTELGELNIKDCPELQVDLLLSGLKYLYKISVEYCNVQTMTLPVALRDLKVQRCKKLQCITELENLTELTELYIIECPELEEIPSLARASHFERIKIVLCDKLQIITLPTTLINLTVQGCRYLQRIAGMPDSREVVELCISDCPELEELPVICGPHCLERVTIDGCGKLSRLQLTDCRILKEVWGTFAQLQIWDCLELQELPCFAHLTCLEGVQIIRCVKLQEITLPANLKLLHLDACTELQSVSEISHLNNLVQLIISKCWQLELNLNLVGMNSLQSITLDGCGKLKSFLLTKCQNLRRVSGDFDVEKFSICDCPELEELTIFDCLGLMCLETIHIESCNKLQNITLPTKLIKVVLQSCRCLPRIEGMDSLTELHIGGCDDLHMLPNLVGLGCLMRIEIDSCWKLCNMTLPTTLSELSVHRCSWQVMEDINNLTKLTKMSISECPEFKEFPNLSKISRLEILNIDSCKRLHTIILPVTLMKLTVSRCRKLKRVVEIANLTKLTDIVIFKCPELEEFPNLSKMFCLESIRFDYSKKLHNITLPITLNKLTVDGSRGLQIVVGINNLTKLTEISISKCPKLEELPNLSEMSCLESFQISSCESLHATTFIKFIVTESRKLQQLAGTGSLTRLTDMVISKCTELELLPNFSLMSCLESVQISSCESLRTITLPTTLTKLRVTECRKLQQVAEITNLTKLIDMVISECPELEQLPNISEMSYLENINIESCGSLRTIALPTTLIKLRVKECRKLQQLVEIANLTKLTDMVISECPKLEELPSLSEMSSLEILDIDSCERLHEIILPTTLRTLRVCFCRGLMRVRGNYPTQVECIIIRKCPNLEKLPRLARVQSISVDSCKKLENIAGIEELKSLEAMQLLFCSNAAIQRCIRKLMSLPSAIIDVIGEASKGAMSNLNPSLLPLAISCADPTTVCSAFDYLKRSVSAIIVCSLVEVSSSPRPGQWIITTVIRDQHYETVRYYSYMKQWNFSAYHEHLLKFARFDKRRILDYCYLVEGKIKKWCAWAVRTDEDWRTLPALTTIVDKLHHK